MTARMLDPTGINTAATVRTTAAMLPARGRILAVSHFYHLPRIKMSYRRAGRDVCTVPARQTRPLSEMPWYMAREVAGPWAYYLRAVVAQ